MLFVNIIQCHTDKNVESVVFQCCYNSPMRISSTLSKETSQQYQAFISVLAHQQRENYTKPTENSVPRLESITTCTLRWRDKIEFNPTLSQASQNQENSLATLHNPTIARVCTDCRMKLAPKAQKRRNRVCVQQSSLRGLCENRLWLRFHKHATIITLCVDYVGQTYASS